MCKGTGWELYQDEKGYEYVRKCKCGIYEQTVNAGRLRFANIPEMYKDVRLKDISTKYYKTDSGRTIIKAAGKFVKDYLDNLEQNAEKGKGIYLWSETKGSGKTMLAAAISNELIAKKKMVKFATSMDILDEIKATYNKGSEESESTLLNDLVNVQFLVIDDFGTERASEWAGEKFYQIINKRYLNKRVTIYTSNYDLKTLKYDDRITNRMRERTYLVHFPEESVREYKAMLENTVTE